MLLAGPLLKLMLHVPPGCGTFPCSAEQSLLYKAGVSGIIADVEQDAAGSELPIVPIIAGRNADELMVDGKPWLWLHGNRASLLTRAASLRSESIGARTSFIASLPTGGASSESALRQSCILAWQLHSTHRCRAIVLSWPELVEAAAAANGSDSGWDSVAVLLTRMRQSEWTTIHGG